MPSLALDGLEITYQSTLAQCGHLEFSLRIVEFPCFTLDPNSTFYDPHGKEYRTT